MEYNQNVLNKLEQSQDEIATATIVWHLIIVTANVSDYDTFSDIVIENWCEPFSRSHALASLPL